MGTPTIIQLAARLTTLDGVGAQVPSRASVPTIFADLNALHTTINQLTLTVQAQLNTTISQVNALDALVDELLYGTNNVSGQTLRVGPFTVDSGYCDGPYIVNFTNVYSDGFYTVEVSIVLNEAISSAPCSVGGITQQTNPGNGINVWIINNDSIIHNATINIYVRHD